ncbi:MAG: DegT/DnrJ/EryC1/StrS family aminotransferase [Candidatus Omnitrophica bacterium]|nr:DegT/DnrJ/EryC1/StrS family aminotransferase [Candidatus Omnitrophota bacterium]MCM8793321.1 DegT/DnrJ/EryC1/StrS family aminotransferase [Candidatus Omnitrophota bacterium]
MKVPFVDLEKQYAEIKKEIKDALEKIFNKGDFILGEEEGQFEEGFAKYIGTKYAVGVNSGTDALFLGLLSLGIGQGDEVIVPAFTYIATALAVSFCGARPVFCDIDEETYNINTNKVEGLITKRTKAIIPVHLYGQPADMKPILEIAKRYDLKVVEDCAQAHGSEYKFKIQNSKFKIYKVGTMGDIGCFSFYPTKNLGACGDGGMVVTNDKDVYRRLLMLRDYGRKSRYEHIIIGYNSRLDTLQAVILSAKLKRLDKWNEMRRKNARIYIKYLEKNENIILPVEESYARHVYHIFAVRIKNRERIIEELQKRGISVLIHYPIPLHLQRAYKELGYRKGDFPVAEKIAQEVLSLPMYPHLTEREIKYVCDNFNRLV